MSRSKSPVPLFTRQKWSRPKSKAKKRDLEAMLRQRDEQIATIEAERSVLSQALVNTQTELSNFREMYNEETLWLGLKVQALDRDRETMAEQIALLNNDMSAEALIQKYAAIIRKSSSKRSSKSYVADLEAQLYKAMHRLEVMSTQLEAVQLRCKVAVEKTKEEMGDVIQEKIQAESELRSKLTQAEQEKKLLESEYQTRMQHRESAIENLSFEVEQLHGKIEILEEHECDNGVKHQLDKKGSTSSMESKQSRKVRKPAPSASKWKSSMVHPSAVEGQADLTSSDISSDGDSIVTVRRGDLLVSGWDDSTIPSESDLSRIFKKVGPLSNIDICEGGKFTIITYVKSKDAKKAVRKYHGIAKISGKPLNVELSKPVVLYDGELLVHGWKDSSRIKEADLVELFSSFGSIDNIDFGEHRDYAIIGYINYSNAQQAAKSFKNGTNIGGAKLEVVRP